MPRPGISGTDVESAVRALREQGRPASLLNVRAQIGRGSFTTIGRELQRLGLRECKRCAGSNQRALGEGQRAALAAAHEQLEWLLFEQRCVATSIAEQRARIARLRANVESICRNEDRVSH